MPNFRSRIAISILSVALCMPSLVCSAQSESYVTDKDLEVAVRAFGFVYGMQPKDGIEIAIVYDPNIPASQEEAQQLAHIIGNGDEIANREVKQKLVPVSNMASAKEDKIVYITHGLEPEFNNLISPVVVANKMLTFSTDFQCVTSKECVMGVEASPSIRIEISRSATNASSLEFSQALKLMIQEVE